MLHATAVGRLGKDPELRSTASGKEVTGFSLGISVYAKGEKQTVWLKCSLWGKRGDTLRQYCHKGDQITVTGPIFQETWQGKDGPVTDLAMDVQDFTLPAAPKEPAAAVASTPSQWNQAPLVPDNDEVPF